jgi:anti-sigma B factor antagonist
VTVTDFSITRPEPGAAVVTVTGPLNVVSASGFRDAVAATVRRDPSCRVVVDLTAVPTVDSSGLGALIGGLKAARSGGGDLRIACAGAQVVTVLDLTNLNQVLPPYPSVQDGLTGAVAAGGNTGVDR